VSVGEMGNKGQVFLMLMNMFFLSLLTQNVLEVKERRRLYIE